ncbi:hypothetical protein K469DRAFT_21050 [Zopfia rhizophila CBS 207.26]|uniref:Uncharacterized protein n=1 Tax=Zopfia rhizophila CBS 207.26 TaxID=1314779 RepID=A0A6A6EUX3_9PEZI|nr:hypothetical protein K469DRAFT_21050 [Zopfia rhizophila CBS 207.26]
MRLYWTTYECPVLARSAPCRSDGWLRELRSRLTAHPTLSPSCQLPASRHQLL